MQFFWEKRVRYNLDYDAIAIPAEQFTADEMVKGQFLQRIWQGREL